MPGPARVFNFHATLSIHAREESLILIVKNESLLPHFYPMWQNLKPEIKKPLRKLALFPLLPFHSVPEHNHTNTYIQVKDPDGLISPEPRALCPTQLLTKSMR